MKIVVEAAGFAGAVLALGVVDYATGYNLHFFVFYFIPIVMAASRHGARAGYAVSVLSAATWFAADWLGSHPYPYAWIGVWNGAMRMIAYAAVSYMVGRIRELLAIANDEVRTLRGFLPICAQCKKIRNAQGYWQQLEAYISQNADVQFSHGLCDECLAATLRGVEAMEATPPSTPSAGPPPAMSGEAGT